MTDKPITLRDWEIRALVAKQAIQIRRPIRLTDGNRGCSDGMACLSGSHATPLRDKVGLVWRPYGGSPEVAMPPDKVAEFSPVGKPGERRWVRQVWATGVKGYIFRSDFDVSDGFGSEVFDPDSGECVPLIWRKSREMPREACRFEVEIESLKAERLSDMDTEDSFASGIEVPESSCRKAWECSSEHWPGVGAFRDDLSNAAGGRPWMECHCVMERYEKRWDEDNRPGNWWSSNPWVWVRTVKVVRPEATP